MHLKTDLQMGYAPSSEVEATRPHISCLDQAKHAAHKQIHQVWLPSSSALKTDKLVAALHGSTWMWHHIPYQAPTDITAWVPLQPAATVQILTDRSHMHSCVQQQQLVAYSSSVYCQQTMSAVITSTRIDTHLPYSLGHMPAAALHHRESFSWNWASTELFWLPIALQLTQHSAWLRALNWTPCQQLH
jgi:hypothetical protein